MVALAQLLPLLCSPEADIPALLDTLSELHITSDVDLLFYPNRLPDEFEVLRGRIQTFLAAEGRPGNALYEEDMLEERRLLAVTGSQAIDTKLLDGGFRGGEVVELIGAEGAGKTFLALTTVLRHLCLHPASYALWLDTTGTFSAERAVRILDALHSSLPLDDIGGAGLPPLDRLIVAKTFDLQAAIQAIQSIKASGFPKEQVGQPGTDEKDDKPEQQEQGAALAGDEAMQVDDSMAAGTNMLEDPDMANGNQQAAGPAEHEIGAGPASPAATQAHAEQAAGAGNTIKPTHLAFIVVDSITAIIRPILTAKSPEGRTAARLFYEPSLTCFIAGHARMVSFMRLLRSLATAPVPLLALITNNTTSTSSYHQQQTVPQPGISAFEALSNVRPSLGPTFSYMCDWTIWIGSAQEAFPNDREVAVQNSGEQTKVVEVWRSRRTPGNRWVAIKTDGIAWKE